MRHRKRKGALSRRTSWRAATLKSLTNDLLTYQRIETTMAKAKALRSYAEPIITTAKKDLDSINARRLVFKKLCNKDVVKNLFDNIAPLYKDVPGGYTRIMSLGNRRGDGAQMVIIELTKRTISDEDLLKAPKIKVAGKTAKKVSKDAKAKDQKKGKDSDAGHSAPDVDIEEKEKRAEDVKKAKARTEQKKIEKKGIFKRFRRKSI